MSRSPSVVVEHPEITLVTDGGNVPLLHGGFHGAAGLVSVRAVGVMAVRNVFRELDEICFHLLRGDVPQRHLPDTRRVGDPSAACQRDQFRRASRMTALPGIVADLTGAKTETGLHGVQQR